MAGLVAIALAACTAGSPSGPRALNATPSGGSARPSASQFSPLPRPSFTLPSSTATGLSGRIAFTAGDPPQVWVVDIGDGRARRLTNGDGSQFDPSWSPDGRRIVYRDSRRGINDNDEIFVMNADGSHKTNVTNDPANDWGPAWSPDGGWIAFSSTRDDPGETRTKHVPRLYVMHPDGSAVHRLTDVEGEYPAWSPDSRMLAFMSAQPGAQGPNPNYDVAIVNADGSGLRRIATSPDDDGLPAWSPDGSTIAFETARDDPGAAAGVYGPYKDIYLVRPDGSGLTRLTEIFANTPSWSPDGRFVLFSGRPLPPRAAHLYVVRPDGSGLALVPTPGVANVYDASWIGRP